MFGCACVIGKIIKQTTAGESEQEIQPDNSMTYTGSHAKKLWKRSILNEDLDEVLAPKMAPPWTAPVKVQKRAIVPRPIQQIREEDKDPVYKYLESMMTCARVREFNSKPPPEVMEPKIPDTSMSNTPAKPQETSTDNLQSKFPRPLTTVRKAAGKTSQETSSNEKGAKRQIEIQSACEWKKDHKMVLEALCRRMNQNRLSQCFSLGPYYIRPIAKIFMRKPSGSVVTYRVHISKPLKASDNDEDESDDSDLEKPANKSFDANVDADVENGQVEEPEMHFGVTPFLGGVTPAGRLRARTKPVGCPANGLIQVNGKSYNQARVLLGNMGSLHPANRLAAYLTDRLHAPADVSPIISQKSELTNKISTLCGLHIKSAGTVVPPVITARKTTDLKTSAQPPVPLFKPDSWRQGSINLPPPSQSSSSINPLQTFIKSQLSSTSPFLGSSMSSPVSLTVSPSLKTPSFLGQSGTYSFRICPPANQGTAGKTPPGVSLPGGFTLIQLPKPGGDGAAQQSESANDAGLDKAQPQKPDLLSLVRSAAGPDANWLGLNIFTGAKDLSGGRSVEPGSFTRQMFEEKMRSAQYEKLKARKVESNLDNSSEELSSDFSDDYGEGDEDEELVDIETVEDVRQGMVIAKMKEALRKALQDSRDSRVGFGLISQLAQSQMEDQNIFGSKEDKRRNNHTVLERLRRSELRDLFDKLQEVLQSDPRAPRLRLLYLAVKEIQRLVENSKSLEEQKRRLEQKQSVYLKKLSILSGKPDNLIKYKLNEIYNRQKIREKKMQWKPFFSQLLQSKAAILEATAPESQLQPPLQPDFSDFFTDKSKLHPLVAAALNSVHKKPTPKPHYGPLAVFSEALLNFNARSPQAEKKPGDPEALDKGKNHQAKLEGQKETVVSTPQTASKPHVPSFTTTPQVTAAQSIAPHVSSTHKSKNPSEVPPKPLPLPLIRSKTGRIILPASLKPLGQGFYTLMFMKPKEDGEEEKPSDVDPSKDKDKSSSESNDQPDVRSSIIKDQSVPTSDSKPQHPSVPASLGDHGLHKSVYVPLVDLKLAKDTSTVAVKGTQGAARMSFHHMPQIPPLVEPKSDPDPPVVRRGRGRPRKNPAPIVGAIGKQTSVDTCKSETSTLFKEVKPEKQTVEVTRTQDADTPPSVKRGRGRPRKDRSLDMWRPPGFRAGSIPSKSDEDSPVRFSFRSPAVKVKEETAVLKDVGTTRPLTRGSLGKDFPSAKKRSWIDVEKELEPELESE
uniref:uncharacterized protein n=1 Tax=Semicossyphus pulcher TaxID=241346 RepID=UPI0037E87DD1